MTYAEAKHAGCLAATDSPSFRSAKEFGISIPYMHIKDSDRVSEALAPFLSAGEDNQPEQ
jgi:hypothetical protein